MFIHWGFIQSRRSVERQGGGRTLPLTLWTNWTNLAAMKTVNVHEAKTNFSSLLAKLERDSETIIICRNGEPVADLVRTSG